jgi:hypothetical protein
MEINKESKREFNKKIDPIGVEIILQFIAPTVAIISLLHQFGVFSKKDHKIKKKFKKLHKQTIKLHNYLDSLILIIQRHSNDNEQNKQESLINKRLTIKETQILLKEKDHIGWTDIQKSLHELSKEYYLLLSEIRELCEDESIEYDDLLYWDVFDEFDELLINFGIYEVGDFVSKLRAVINNLTINIRSLITDDHEQSNKQ